jgi:hypothetical protein
MFGLPYVALSSLLWLAMRMPLCGRSRRRCRCSAGAATASSLVLLTAHPQGAPRGKKRKTTKVTYMCRSTKTK